MTSLYQITIVHDLHLSSTILLQRMLRYHYAVNITEHIITQSTQVKSLCKQLQNRREERGKEDRIAETSTSETFGLNWLSLNSVSG